MKQHMKTWLTVAGACALVGVVTLKSNRDLSIMAKNYAFSLEMRMRANSMQDKDTAMNNGVRRAVEGDAKTSKADKDERLHLIWQIAYPFSGSTVALRIIQDYTGYSMATNYGDIVDTNRGFEENMHDSVPVNADTPNGPYKYRIDKPLPPLGSNVVTKTHCSGHCMDLADDGSCPLENVVGPLTVTRSFFQSCASGTKFTFGKEEEHFQYNPWQVKKIMILVRNPLEIILARFLNLFDGGRYPGFPPNHDGLVRFCKSYDERQEKKGIIEWYRPEAKSLVNAGAVMCHAELFRITNFYNQATRLAQYMGNDTGSYTVHFEDYDCEGCDVGEHIDDILNFLQIPVQESSNMRMTPFVRHGMDDSPYFTQEDIDGMIAFIKAEANPATLHLFNGYV